MRRLTDHFARLLVAFSLALMAAAPAHALNFVGVQNVGLLSVAKPFVGMVTLRNGFPVSSNANTESNADFGTVAAQDINGAVKVILWNGKFDNNTQAAESINAAATEWGCSIQYPAGTWIADCTFGGALTYTAATNTLPVVTDWIGLGSVTIPAGATAIVRTWMHNTTGINFINSTWVSNATYGDKQCVSSSNASTNLANARTGATATTLTTGNMGGSASCVTTQTMPVVLLGLVSPNLHPTVVVGDSIGGGKSDTNGSNLRAGIVLDGVSASIPTLNLSSGGGQVTQWRTTSTYAPARLAILGMGIADNFVSEIGTNDKHVAVRTQAQIEGDLEWLYTQVVGARHIFQTTITHKTASSSDTYLTLANQTTTGSDDSNAGVLFLLNADIKTLKIGRANGFFDTAAGVMNAPATPDGKWKVDGVTANYCTADGIHPSPACYALGAAGIDNAKFQ
jgi:hypothetical protein